MELQGLTPVDTLYEYVGHAVGFRLSQYLLWGGYLLSFVIAAALLRLYYLGSREGTFVDLAVYPLYVLILLFLAWPMEVALLPPAGSASPPGGSGRLGVPRILAYAGALTNRLQQSLIDEVGQTAGASLHEWERIAAINERTRLLRPENRRSVELYARYCYWPAIAQGNRPPGEPWDQVPLAGLPIDAFLAATYGAQGLLARTAAGTALPCSDLHAALSGAISEELRTEAFHQASQAALSAAAGAGPSGAGPGAFYRRRILYNELYRGGGGELAAVRQALPAYGFLDATGSIDLIHMASDLRAGPGAGSLRNLLVNLPTVVISGLSAASEWWSQRAAGPATYYRVSSLGPYLYGMAISVLLMLFPLAALLAFWPRGWVALVNHLKLFLSVKLWPVLWSFLSGILSGRNVFTGADPNGFEGALGGVGMFPAIASMYVLVPALSFLIVHLAQHGGGAVMGGFLGGSAGIAIGTARSMVSDLVSGGAAAIEGAAGTARSVRGPERPRSDR